MNTLAEIQRLLCNLIRIGTVLEIDYELHRARVETGENQTDWLQWPEQNAATVKTSNPPEIGETWLLLSPSGDLSQAVLALRLSSEQFPALENSGTKKATEYPDGTKINYDHESHELEITIPESGALNVTVNGPVNISAPEITLGESSSLEPSVLGDQLAAALEDLINQINLSQVIGNLGAPSSPINAVKPIISPDLLSGGGVYSQKNRNQ